MVEAHCGILLPFSHHLAAIVEALPYAGPIQVLERPNQWQIRYDFEPVFLSKSILSHPDDAGRNKHQSCDCCQESDLLRDLLP